MAKNKLKAILEATLMVAGKPLTVEDFLKLFEDEKKPSKKEINDLLKSIEKDCTSRGYELKKLSNTYRFQAKKEYAKYIARLWEEKPPKLSKALLETLAIIAYKQPITRAEVESIRGVATSVHILKTLSDLEWIKIVAYRDLPGKPAVYGTTVKFLDYFNLASLEDLPALATLIQPDASTEMPENSTVENIELKHENVTNGRTTSVDVDTDSFVYENSEHELTESDAVLDDL